MCFYTEKHVKSGGIPHCVSVVAMNQLDAAYKKRNVCGDTDPVDRIRVVSNSQTKTSITEIHILSHA